MGNFQDQAKTEGQNQQKCQFLDKIDKVYETTFKKFGKCNVYQLKEKPYDYYLQYIEAAFINKQILTEKLKFYNNLPKSKNLVPVQYAEVFERKQLCAVFDGLRVFCPYYNFTIEDAIKLKIKQKNYFVESEVVYILKSLLSIGKFYQKQLKTNFYSGIYKSESVFISPEGHIKIYPFNQNIFTVYMDKKQNSESPSQNSNLNSNKVSIYLDQKIKPYCPTRQQSGIFKNNLNNSHSKLRKSKIMTTLKKDRIDSIKSQEMLQLKGIQSNQISRRPSNSILSHQQSSQTFSYLYTKLNQTKEPMKRDLFELGLLMMQIVLLNGEHEYYKQKIIQKNEDFNKTQQQNSKFSQSFNSNYLNSMDQHNSLNFDRVLSYQNQNGEVPVMDLIIFSVTKLLPRKNISQAILNLIEKMIMGDDQQFLDYDNIFQTVQRYQNTLSQPKYCLKFQLNTQEKKDHSFSNYSIKQRPSDEMIKHNSFNISNLGLGSSNVNNKYEAYQPLKQNQSTQILSLSTKKLQDLINYNILVKSMVVEQEDNSYSSQILNKLKKSRKLVPSKIRSISVKIDDKKNDKHQIKNFP